MIQFIQNMEKIVPFILTKYFDFWSWFLIDEKSFNKSFNASADHFQFTLHHVGLWTFGCHSDRSLEITIEFGCHSLKNFWPIESLLHNTVVAVCSTQWGQIFYEVAYKLNASNIIRFFYFSKSNPQKPEKSDNQG